MFNKPLVYILKGFVKNRGVRLGSRIFGRSVGIAGWVIGGFSSVKIYKTYMKNDPHNKRIAPLEEELGKWSDTISCIGRRPYYVGDICSIDEGGSINSLGKKELFSIPNTRYGSVREKLNLEYHAAPDNKRKKPKVKFREGSRIGKMSRFIDPCPAEARGLLQKAVNYVQTTKDVIDIEDFKTRKDKFVEQLTNINNKLKIPYEPGADYTPIQQELSAISHEMIDIEFEYKSRISKLEHELFKRRIKYATVAVSSLAIGTLTNLKTKKA